MRSLPIRSVIGVTALSAFLVGCRGNEKIVVNEYYEQFTESVGGSLPAHWTTTVDDWRVDVAAERLLGSSPKGPARATIPYGPWSGFRLAFDLGIDKFARRAGKPEEHGFVAIGFGGAREDRSSTHQIRIERGARETFVATFLGTTQNGKLDGKRFTRARSRAFEGPAFPTSDQPAGVLRLRLESVAGRVRFYVDDVLVIDSALGRDVVLGELAFELQNVEVSFDNVDVERLSADEIAALRVAYGPLRPIRTIAHRGASWGYPENTIAAVKGGIEAGSDAIEVDVYRTKDGEVVLFHDHDVHRTTNFKHAYADYRSASINDFTFKELQKLDAGSWKGRDFRWERIPSLKKALETLRGKSTMLIEIKPDNISKDVARVVREAKMENEVVVQSFSAKAVRDFHAELPGVPMAFLTGSRVSSDPIERARAHLRSAREAHANALGVNYQLVTPEYLAEVHRHAMSVWVYTVNEHEVMDALVRMGVDGIITDRPAMLRELLGLPVPGPEKKSDERSAEKGAK